MTKHELQTVYAVFGTTYEEYDGIMVNEFDYLASDLYAVQDDALAELDRLLEQFFAAEDPVKYADPDIIGDCFGDWTWEKLRMCPEWQEPYELRKLTLHLEKVQCPETK